MKTTDTRVLIENLQADVRQLILATSRLSQYAPQALSQAPAAGRWSVAQVLEHLNIYCRFYINAIEARLHQHGTKAQKQYKPGWLGNYFTALMQPGANNTIAKKMKAPKNAIPAPQPDALAMQHEFLQHQHHLINLLDIARTANIQELRIPTSLSKFITMQLGDTFRFVIAHQQRHFIQIHNTLAAVAPTPAAPQQARTTVAA